jgi:cation diffusion facilitator family transporter
VQGHAEVPHPDATTLVVIGITLVVNVVVAVWQTRAGQRLQSGALLSAATDTRGDIVVTIGVLVSTALVALGYHALDVVAGIVVAGFIGFTAFSILKENLNYLADRALVHADQVLAIATAVPGVLSASDVRTRGAPGAIFVDLHIQVAGETTVAVAHDVSHLMADHIRSEIAGIADVHVHIEPA